MKKQLVLREYQKSAHKTLVDALINHGKGLLVAPTGSGKTITGLKCIIDVAESEKLSKIVWVAHQTALALQSMNAMLEHFHGSRRISDNTVELKFYALASP
jgi:superfamily II DNA or RNA helicase